jgi:hypothetical protein
MKGMLGTITGVVCAALVSGLSGCSNKDDEVSAKRADWVIESRVQFRTADGKTVVDAPKEPMRLWMPYVVGDFYGSPNEGEITPVTLMDDLTFTIDLNPGHAKLQKALVPTAFSQKWMTIEPANARVARLSPFVMPKEGIAPIGVPDWLDPDTGSKLMLIYVDRPARIRGEIVWEGRNLRFDIEAKEAGYLWVQQPEGSGEYRAANPPVHPILTVMPPS